MDHLYEFVYFLFAFLCSKEMSGRHLFSSKDIVDFKLEFMKNYQLKNLSKKRFFSMMMISALCTASPSSIFANVNEVQITMQAATLKGQVITESGEPVIGASVMLKGTSNGTITDLDGNFTLKGMSKGTLVISFIGYITQEIPLNGKTSLKVILKEDTKTLDEVVVIGYGTQRKEELTSSVMSVKAENFVQVTTPDAAGLIKGKVAGLSVINPDANPLSTSEIVLRGSTTLKSGTSPLILIDGVPGELNSVSPNDIEQIDVLKDGSAAAIYGTRGTNGVILITTKTSKGEMKPTIEVNSYISFQKIAKRLPMMSTEQYLEKVKEGYTGATDYGSKTNWLDEIMQTPFNQTYSINLRGGSKNTNYIASFDYTSNEGLVKRSKVETMFPRLNVTHRMFDDKLKIDAGLSGYQQSYSIPYNTNVYQSALIYNPTQPIKDENGKWTEVARDLYYNPLALLNETQGKNDATNLRMHTTITVTPLEGLDIKWLLSREVYNKFSGYYETKNHRSTTIQNKNGYASRETHKNQADMTELTIQYNKVFKGGHSLNALAGYSWNKNNNQEAFMDNYNFPTDDYSYNNMAAGTALKEGKATEKSYQEEYKLVGYFGRINYNYQGRYYLSASIRHEGSSKFGADHKWGTFPAVSIGWNLKEESFLKNVRFLSFLKLRAGYGITGTIPGSPYLSLNTLDLGGYGYYGGQWTTLLRASSNPNSDLRWEKKKETNIGLDFAFFNDRISGSIDWYNRDTDDLIWDYTVSVPPYVKNTITANAGSIRNRGLEVSLNFIPVKTKSFTWNTGINFSTNSNELVSLSNGKYSSSGYTDLGDTYAPIQQKTHRVQEGMAIGNFWGYKSIDIDENGHWIIEGADGKPKPIAEQQADDKQVLGNGLPKWYLNWNNSLRYKQFDLSITMRGAFGFQILNMPEMNYAAPVSLGLGNVMEKAFDNVYGKRPLAADQELQHVSYYVQDGDYWKIDNLTIGYTPVIKENKWIKGVRIYGSISNLATITKYSGIDPEVNVTGLTPGVDNMYRYPSARTFSIGVNLNF